MSLYRRFHDRFGTAGLVVAVIALIAALAGTALAAGGLTKQQEKQVTKIAKKYAGKPGATGPQGPQGPAGAKGDTGAKGDPGSAGAPGAAGKSVIASNASGVECSEGGTKFEVEGSGKSSKVCNGKEGPEGPTGPEGALGTAGTTLPPGATETGTWGFGGKFTSSTEPIVPISFSIPLAAPLGPTKVHLIDNDGEEVVINEGSGAREFKAAAAACSGTAANPTAGAGNLCLYSGSQLDNINAAVFIGSNLIHTPASECEGLSCLAAAPFNGPGAGTSTSGALLGAWPESEQLVKAWGTWAVTG
jgi:Collagen triple helix repeat (20 copies)